MRVLICGSRSWPWQKLHMIANRLDEIAAWREPLAPHDSPIEFVITGGAKGVDTWADEAAERRGLDRVIVPANWRRDGRAGGPIRNERMASLLRPGIDLVLAFRAEGESRGTDDMVGRARRRGVEVEVIQPYRRAVEREGAAR